MKSGNGDAKLRLNRVLDRINGLNLKAHEGITRRLTAHPRLSDRNRVVTYSLQVHGRVVDPDWEFDLAEILLNTRALLDNLMWALAHSDASVTYSKKEERYITFPIVTTVEAWDQAVRTKAHLNRLSADLLSRVRAMQPIDSDDRPDDVLNWVDALHRVDKHQDRLRITGGLDPQWPMFFRLRAAGRGDFQREVQWLTSPDQALRSKVDIARVTCSAAVKPPPVEEVPCALFATVDDERYDLQDFLWDVNALAFRAYEVLQGAEPVMFRGLRTLVEHRRARLAAFNRSILFGTDEYETFRRDTFDYEIEALASGG